MLTRALECYRNGNLEEAAQICRRLLKSNPKETEALYLLGAISHQGGNQAMAIECMRRALAIAPKHAECWNILGLAQMVSGDQDSAAVSFERAMEFGESAEFPNNLGSLRKAQGRLDDALAAYQLALGRDPNFADAQFNLGTIYRDRREMGRAAKCFRHAAEANPADGEAWYSAGAAYVELSEFALAASCLTKALELQPNSPAALHDFAKALFNLGYVDDALEYFRRAAKSDRPQLPMSMIATIIPGAPGATNQTVLQDRVAFARWLPAMRPARERERGRPLRVGYVSSFFHRENWMKPVWPLIRAHDRNRFDVHLFSDAPLKECHDISELSNEAAADLIAQCGIDILIDLNGYSKVRRLGLIALKPAPVVVGWFNMYATTGIAAYDYLIGDEIVIPSEEERFYSEKILRVPGSYLTFAVDYPVPDVAPPPCLRNGFVTFGSLASLYKITPEVRNAWLSILRAVPESRLLLKNAALGSAANGEHVRAWFTDIAPERVRLEGPSDHYAFLQAYDEIDIALDTFPYNGGTTTTEAIWQGVPVVTFWGDRWASRTSASLLRAAGLGDDVAADVSGYVARAIECAAREPRRIRRDDLRRSQVCDVAGFARAMERIYTNLGAAP